SPRTHTKVLHVPRSMPMSTLKRPSRSSNRKAGPWKTARRDRAARKQIVAERAAGCAESACLPDNLIGQGAAAGMKIDRGKGGLRGLPAAGACGAAGHDVERVPFPGDAVA